MATMTHLPNELILQIFESLEKYDLKSARLVSKDWSTMSAVFLFDEVFISVHPENLAVFKAVTQHPLLSKCVKRLIYDVAEFNVCVIYDIKWFADDLWMQTCHMLASNPYRQSFEVHTSDSELNTWMNLILAEADHPLGRGQPEPECLEYNFISLAYQKYKGNSASRSTPCYNADFIAILIEGLERLKTLSCVVMDEVSYPCSEGPDDSKKLVPRRPAGRSLARTWNVFQAWPGDESWGPESYRPDLVRSEEDVGGHYATLACALVRSQRKITSFEIGRSGCTPSQFCGIGSLESLSCHSLGISAFSGLRTFKLSFTNIYDRWLPEGLRPLLFSMTHLKTLNLEFPFSSPEDDGFMLAVWTCSDVFPAEGQWSQLTSLSLQQLISNAADLVTLLTHQMPNLKDLQLGIVKLLTGTWEGMIECMTQSMHLTSFHLLEGYSGFEFWHRGNTRFLDSLEASENTDLCCQIQEYVKHGGRHPCLKSDEPDIAARNFVTEDFPPWCWPVPSIRKVCH